MFSIGELSKITGLSVKALRFYHEEGLLEPSHVDAETGYRYYASAKVETARAIAFLRGLDFTVHEICEILAHTEDDADFEACMPVRAGKPVDGISVRELEGGRCVSLMHKGSYSELGGAYAKIFEFIHQKGYEPLTPSREIYHKGPGMIFKGNPRNYLTEIQVLIRPADEKP